MTLHRLDYITREIPDLEGTRRFYRDFGLAEVGEGVFATVNGGVQLHLRRGDASRIVAIGVGADARSDLDDVEARLGEIDIRANRDGDRVHVIEPVSRVQFEISVSPRLPKELPPASGGEPRDRRDLVPRDAIRPQRLGHVGMVHPDVSAGERFLQQGLGMRLSDYVGGASFMRFETDHHNVVLVPGGYTILHHTAWKVRSVDEIGYGGSEMVRREPARHAWGLGRHAASANYFWYLKDPGGAFAEYYYSEMDELADTPLYWDPPPDAPVLPPAVWSSPPLDAPLIPEIMRTPLEAGEHVN